MKCKFDINTHSVVFTQIEIDVRLYYLKTNCFFWNPQLDGTQLKFQFFFLRYGLGMV